MIRLNFYLPGAFLILSGILIIAFPEILIALVASVIIMAGISALYLGHKIRKSNDEYNNINGDDWIETRHGNHRDTLFRYWGRWF